MYRRVVVLFGILISIIYTSTNIEAQSIADKKTINVEVRGNVKQEKVYEVPIGTKVNDILEEIDLKDDADISAIGLNDTLKNNQIIVIPKLCQDKKISINSASKQELMSLKGIGEKMAISIIEYRNNNGGFKSIEELKNVSGIGEKKFNQIKENITL